MAPPRRLLAAIALVALLGAGCANAPAETGSGGGGGGGGNENAATEAGPNPGLRLDIPEKDKLAEFAKCMRENGVGDFPDPGDDGVIRYSGDMERPEFESARENCQGIIPEQGNQGSGG